MDAVSSGNNRSIRSISIEESRQEQRRPLSEAAAVPVWCYHQEDDDDKIIECSNNESDRDNMNKKRIRIKRKRRIRSSRNETTTTNNRTSSSSLLCVTIRRIVRIRIPRILLFIILSTIQFHYFQSTPIVVVDAWGSIPTSSSKSTTSVHTPASLLQRHENKNKNSKPIIPRSNLLSLFPLKSWDRHNTHVCFSTATPQSSSSSSSSTSDIDSTKNTTTTTTVSIPSSARQNKNNNNNNRNRNRRPMNGGHANSHKFQKKNDRNSIQQMFQTAKTIERQGRWGEAFTLLEEILVINPKDSHSHLAIARLEARRELKITRYNNGSQQKQIQSECQSEESTTTDDSKTKAQIAFEKGVTACPRSVFLLQGWAIYESQQQSLGSYDRARELFERALELEPYNTYVCHAYSIMEKKLGNTDKAVSLLKKALNAPYGKVTAALVCSLGEFYVAEGNLTSARDLYKYHLDHATGSNIVVSQPQQRSRQKHLPTEKDRVEVYLAAAWLEERNFGELHKARDLLNKALTISPTSSLANVALARLKGRISATASATATAGFSRAKTKKANRHDITEVATMATKKQLATICAELHKQGLQSKKEEEQYQLRFNSSSSSTSKSSRTNEDGRVFNALASLEVKQRNFKEARDVLQKGMDLYPLDHNLFTAAGKVEERVGNCTSARDFYSESLRLEPSAPTLVAFALLELKYPQYPSTTVSVSTDDGEDDDDDSSSNEKEATTTKPTANFTFIRGLFEEALMLDPRNGPAYNAYGNAELRRGNLQEARIIFERGTAMNCSDSASLYHGYGMLEISSGNLERARDILYRGLDTVRRNEDNVSSDTPNRDRAAFLSHTLGMLELNSNRPLDAFKIFMDGLDRCGNSSQLLLGAALCEMRMGKDEGARGFFERSVVADNKHAHAWQAWGVMETKAGHFHRAAALFQKGIKNAPWHGSLWHGYASLEVRRDNIENARTLFTGGLKKARNGIFALYQGWAILELREGNYEKARKLISEALTLNKQNGRGWIIAAEIEEEDGHAGLAALLLRRGIECDPNNGELYNKLGTQLIERQGKINDAREVYEKGIELNPLYAPLYHSLAELEARIGNFEGLSKLNKRTNEIFKYDNALESVPRSQSYQALETKINATHNRPISQFFVGQREEEQLQQKATPTTTPRVVSALADKIVTNNDDDDDETTTDDKKANAKPTLEDLNVDGLVGDMMSVESILNDTDTHNKKSSEQEEN
jgi:tetratricopeptide (TPR) repeat protein